MMKVKLAREDILVGILSSLYIGAFSFLSWLRFSSFGAYALDLGLFEQSFWNTLHGGGIFYNTIEHACHFKVHLSPIMFLILPFYAIYQHTITLLILQTVGIAAGGVFLYLIGKETLSKKEGSVLVAIYFLYPAVWGINLFDWHPVAFAIPFLIGSFYFFKRRKYKLYALFVALSLACKETVALPVLLLGFYGLWEFRTQFNWLQKFKFREALPFITSFLTIGVAIIWLALAFITPSPEHYSLISYYYGYLGTSITEVIWTVITNPLIVLKHLFTHSSFYFLITLFAPLAFLPFLSPQIVGISGLSFLAILLASPPIQLPINQYPSTIVPFLFIAMIFGLSKLNDGTRRKLLIVAFIATILSAGLVQTSNYSRFNTEVRLPSAHDRIMEKVLKKIPSQASVLTTSTYFAQLSRRPNVYLLSSHPAAFKKFPKDVDYILLDPKAPGYPSTSRLKSLRKVMGDMGLYIFVDGAYVLKRGFSGKPLKIELPLRGSLKMEYYKGDNFQKKIYEGPTTSINFKWGKGAPAPFLPKDHFTILWKGMVYAPKSGQYIFSLHSDDGAALYIDDQKIVGELHKKIFKGLGKEELEKGWHSIEIKFWEWEGSAMINLKWKKPGSNEFKEISGQWFRRNPLLKET